MEELKYETSQHYFFIIDFASLNVTNNLDSYQDLTIKSKKIFT